MTAAALRPPTGDRTGPGGCPPPRPRFLVVQHADFAGLGLADRAFAAASVTVDTVHVDAGADVPADLTGFAALVVLGGPQSVLSDDGFPTRAAETALVAQAVAGRVPFLGICLGAQLLAQVAGGVGYRGRVPEIGWTPAQVSPAAATDPLFGNLPPQLTVMQSHYDHYTLPADVPVLVTGQRYPNQAFRVGPCAWGTQFHPEADAPFTASRRLLVPGWAAEEATVDQVTEAAHLAVAVPRFTNLFTAFARYARQQAGD